MAWKWISMLQILGRGIWDTLREPKGAVYPQAGVEPAQIQVCRRIKKLRGPAIDDPNVVFCWKVKGPARTYGARSFFSGGAGLQRLRTYAGVGRPCSYAIYKDCDVAVWVPEHIAGLCLRLIIEAIPGIQYRGNGKWRNLRKMVFRYTKGS